MKREEKQQVISDLHAVFKSAGLVVVALNKGLTASETKDLRRAVRADGASYRVAKNRLAKLALAGTPCESLADLLVGPTNIAYSADEIAAARAVVKMAKDNDKIVVVGGIMKGARIDAAKVAMIAALPTLDGIRGTLIGLLQAPAGQLARVTKAYADKAA